MRHLSTLCVLLLLAAALLGCAMRPTNNTLPVVDVVDTSRYLGTWYEIARYENWFEKGCASATADYELQDDYIRVTNRCFAANGREINVAQGRVYHDGNGQDGKFKVTFFRPFYGAYWVIMLADDYRYAVVGHPDRDYLWILSRTRTLTDTDREAILARLPGLGYDPEKLLWADYRTSSLR